MPESDTRSPVLAWIDRWLLTLWTPIVLAIVLSPLFWLARSGNETAGLIVTFVIEALGALMIVSLVVKIWWDRRRSRRS